MFKHHEIVILDEIEDFFRIQGSWPKFYHYFPFVLSTTDVQCRGEIQRSSLFNFVKPIFLQKSIQIVYNKAVLSFWRAQASPKVNADSTIFKYFLHSLNVLTATFVSLSFYFFPVYKNEHHIVLNETQIFLFNLSNIEHVTTRKLLLLYLIVSLLFFLISFFPMYFCHHCYCQ